MVTETVAIDERLPAASNAITPNVYVCPQVTAKMCDVTTSVAIFVLPA